MGLQTSQIFRRPHREYPYGRRFPHPRPVDGQRLDDGHGRCGRPSHQPHPGGLGIRTLYGSGRARGTQLGSYPPHLNEKGYHTPLVADIHFNPRAADAAACNVEKVRINPGNYVDRVKTFSHLEYTDEDTPPSFRRFATALSPSSTSVASTGRPFASA